MSFYLFCLILGFAGLVVMAVGGLGQHVHHGSVGHGGHDVGDVSLPGHGGGHAAGAGAHGHGYAMAQPGNGHGHAQHDHAADGAGRGAVPGFLLSLLSPRVLFSVLVGMGATGLLAEPWLGGAVLFAAAAAGGLFFEKALVGPLWSFLLRFASAPALTLESSVMDEARAVTGFDARGQGLVAIELDGQLVQVLGTLSREEREAGIRVRAGDVLTVQEVDSARNRCVVSRTGT